MIGHPIAHSRSPMIHGHWLDTLGIAGSYERIDVAPEALPGFLSTCPEAGFVGGNVTVPHKEAVFAWLGEHGHTLSETARRLGAVNTLSLLPDGRLRGHNTDGEGFVASVDEAVGAGWEKDVERAVVLGAGGAARAIVGALLERGLPRIAIVNRTAARAEAIRSFAPDRIEVLTPDAIARRPAGFLVNTTSLGMKGQPPLELDLSFLRERSTVADIVYVPAETRLLAAARGLGLRPVGGLGMLLHQAVPGFELWFGRRPNVDAALRAKIERDIGP